MCATKIVAVGCLPRSAERYDVLSTVTSVFIVEIGAISECQLCRCWFRNATTTSFLPCILRLPWVFLIMTSQIDIIRGSHRNMSSPLLPLYQRREISCLTLPRGILIFTACSKEIAPTYARTYSSLALLSPYQTMNGELSDCVVTVTYTVYLCNVCDCFN